jgi:hypothetical protein
MGAKQVKRLDAYSVQPRKLVKFSRDSIEGILPCRYPNVGHHAAIQHLQRKKLELYELEQKVTKELQESSAKLEYTLCQKQEENQKNFPRVEEQIQASSGTNRNLKGLPFMIDKTDLEIQQEKINCALLGAILGTAVILTAMGIQSFLTYTLETLMPSPQYKWISLALIMLLYMTLLYFLVAFWCI